MNWMMHILHQAEAPFKKLEHQKRQHSTSVTEMAIQAEYGLCTRQSCIAEAAIGGVKKSRLL
jgi:hypothetical protein